jgi:hypothetical protein
MSGLLVVQPEFDQVGDFSEGLATFRIGNKWGFVNKRGEIVVDPQFESAVSFSGGLAIVELGGGKWGYIDKKGKFVWKSFE